MRLEGIEAQAENLLTEKEFITEAVQQKPQQCVGATTTCITECLQRQPFSKGLVKKINNSGNLVMNHNSFLAGAKIIVFVASQSPSQSATAV